MDEKIQTGEKAGNVSFETIKFFMQGLGSFIAALIVGVIVTTILRAIFKGASIWLKLIFIAAAFACPHYLYPYFSKTYHLTNLFAYNLMAYGAAAGFSVGLFIEPFRSPIVS
ncbi:MAG: hypothetical protein M1536_00640 [Firmicutes bacterium]|nr:hypothetical protein [Bacillota bacterium]